MTENTTDMEQQHFAAAQEQLERILPLLQESAASTGMDLPIMTLLESSCLGQIVENRQEQTQWQGILRGVFAEPAQAQTALDAITASLEAEGWNFEENLSDPAEAPDFGPALVYRKDGIHIDASYRVGDPNSLEVFATTSCVDHPTDHQMLRSTLDPSYGKSSKYYPDGQ